MANNIDRAGTEPLVLSLPSKNSTISVEIVPFGFTVHKILIARDGKAHDILIGPHDSYDHKLHREFLGTIVGRYSNRLPSGIFLLQKDGVESELVVSPTESPSVNLHGGVGGLDRRLFETVDPIADSKGYTLFSPAEKLVIEKLPKCQIFKVSSPAGDQGFPGKLDIEVLVALTGPNDSGVTAAPDNQAYVGGLIIVYRAKVDTEGTQARVVTPVNLTQHWGFNLDASLAGNLEQTPDVKEHRLTIKAPHILELEPNGLATGKLGLVSGTAHDHNSKLIGESFPQKGYDSFYLFPRTVEPQHPCRLPLASFPNLDLISSLVGQPDEAAQENVPVILSSERSGITLRFQTNQPGVQFYSGHGLQGQGSRKITHGGTGKKDIGDGYQATAAAFLEFHEPLAAWLHPWGETHGDTLLLSEELYHNYTKINMYCNASG